MFWAPAVCERVANANTKITEVRNCFMVISNVWM
jgi:hypothetical protein